MMTFIPKSFKIRSFGILFLLLAFLSAVPTAHSQVVNEVTKKKVSIGFGMFADIWLKVPSGIDLRTINQGVNVFALYNVPFGKSPVGFSIGLGIRVHNVYGDFYVDHTVFKDTTTLERIPYNVPYKRSKMTLVYMDIPVEFNLKTKVHVNMAIGFKAGILLASHTKYVGNGIIETTPYTINTLQFVRIKTRGIPNLEQFTYGPTFRIGYKWISFDSFFMISSVFHNGHGPEMTPISLGFVLMPF